MRNATRAIKRAVMSPINQIRSLSREVAALRSQIGQFQSVWARRACAPRDAEFGVFSQWGEDGIIQFLLGRVPVPNPVFIEFGVQDYSESNTRFLLEHDNWKGLIIDGGDDHVRFIEKSGLRWRHQIDALTAFITRENVNEIIHGAGVSGDIGLLSIDVDGVDYWLLERIECVSPRILIVEYNSTFGPEVAVSVPYRPDFERTRAHSSNLYFGASIVALARLAERKGYALVTSNSAGNDAFFVRRDVMGDLREVSAAEAWVESRFRESRDVAGNLSYVSAHQERLRVIRDMPLVDVNAGRTATVGEIFSV